MTETTKWWKNPQGLVATATIATMILGFFYVREKQMWEQSTRISAVEKRGDTAIERADKRFGIIEQTISAMRDQVNFLERKIDHLEFKQRDQDQNKQ